MINKKVSLRTSIEQKGIETDNNGGTILKIGGFANASTKDRGNEIITPDAWRKGIKNYQKNPVVLFNHDMSKPIGTVTNIKITDEGLYIEANISSAAERLYGTQTLIRDGSLKAFSVGFYPLKGKKDTATDTLYITEVELLENSIVSIPMNQDSIFSVIKSMDEEGRTKFLSEVEEYDSTQIKMKEGDLGLEKKEITINVTVTGITDNCIEHVMSEDYPEDETEDTTMMAARSAIIDAISEKVNTAVHDFSSRDFVLDKGKKTVIDSRFYRVLGHDLLNHEISAQEVTILGNPINNILKIDDRSIVMLNLDQDKVEFKTVKERDNSEIEELFTKLQDKTTETTNDKYITYLKEKAVEDWNSDDYVIANKMIDYILHRGLDTVQGHVEETIKMTTTSTEVNSSAEVASEIPVAAAVVAEPKVLGLVEAASKATVALDDAREVGSSQIKALEARLDGLMAELAQNKDRLAAANNEKVAYATAQSDSPFSGKDLAVATMLAYGRNPGRDFSLETFKSSDLGKRILNTKATITSVAALTTDFSAEIMKQMEIQLKVAPMLRSIDVTGQEFKVPVADEDTNGDIAMFANGTYNVGETDSTRVPTTRQNTITAVGLTPHKFMGTTHLAKDEQEDVLIPLLQFQIDALTRRMARAIDKSLLRGDGSLTGFTAAPTNTITAGTGYASVITGLVTLAGAQSGLKVASGGNSTKATPASIASARTLLGRYGLEVGANLVYFTSIEGYNDLVTTSDFRTIEKFGERATYITGQVGAIYGIPVVVTEFMDVVGSSGNHIGALVYLPGFIIGRRRAVEVETWYDPRRQLNTIYLSTRFDMKALTTVASAALNTTGYSMASVVTSNA